jgi:hypothetical protein
MSAEQVIHVETTSTAPPGAVFDLLADHAGWASWSSFAESEVEAPAPGGEPGGVGAVRRLRAPGRRTWTRERVVGFERPHRFAYSLLAGLPLDDYVAEVTLEPRGEGTAITWRSTFRARRRGTGWFYRSFLRRFIARTADKLAEAAPTPPRAAG